MIRAVGNEIQGNNDNVHLPHIADTWCSKISMTCWWNCISKGTSLCSWVFFWILMSIHMLKQSAYSFLFYLYWISLFSHQEMCSALCDSWDIEKFVNCFEKRKVLWRKSRRGRNHGLWGCYKISKFGIQETQTERGVLRETSLSREALGPGSQEGQLGKTEHFWGLL